ncbi:MAG: ABC transporter permease [Bacillota bacterium]
MKLFRSRPGIGFGFLSSVFAIAVGLLFGLIILLISNPAQAFRGFHAILMGATFGGMRSVGQILYFATPIVLTGLSVGFAFKTGLFNIGAPGQFIVGAFGAVLVGVLGTSLGQWHWIIALLAALVLGALWAAIPGVLKAYANVNEVISSIMMNYIGMYLVNYLVARTIFDSLRNQSLPVKSSAIIPKMGLGALFPRSNVNGGFFIAVLAVILIHIVLNKTTFGYELKAVGLNRFASQYAGIDEKRSIICSMLIAGALAGLGGGLLYLAGSGKHIEVVDVLAAEGFQGIPVALLGLSSPLGILLAGLFIAYITVGGFYMQLYDFVPEVIDIIVASIIYFSAFSLIIKTYLERRRSRAGGGKANG